MRSTLHNNDWEEVWKEQLTPWDLGRPTPALVHELQSMPHPEGHHWRALVPGCGTGYDLLSLAQYGDNWIASKRRQSSKAYASVVGMDLSTSALERAAQVLDEAWKFQPTEGSTRLDLIHGDFFDSSRWTTVYTAGGDGDDSPNQDDEYFDFIFDYTFFCALPPELRQKWGRRTVELLQPNKGRLLTLIFPILPGAKPRGPPYPVTVDDYERVLSPEL